MSDFNMPIKQGWQCPICKTVYSPSVLSCSCVSQEIVITDSTSPRSDYAININKTNGPILYKKEVTTSSNQIMPFVSKDSMAEHFLLNCDDDDELEKYMPIIEDYFE